MVEDDLFAEVPRERGIFCNRTLNMRSIRAIGYDMDYTLIHYLSEAWERRAYEHLRQKLLAMGWPVDSLAFDPGWVIRGLCLDLELGNVVKPNRFGYVKRAYHGTRRLEYDEQRRVYARTIVDLSEPRWVFLNTFFSLSEGCMYGQLVDLLDARRLPEVLGYTELYDRMKRALDLAHMEGALKAEITERPEDYVVLDPETPLALLDQRRAGKKLLLVSNSEWFYTRAIMRYAFDRFLPDGMGFRDLFDVFIVSARKPEFFTERAPLFEVVNDDGLCRPALGLSEGRAFLGGHAGLVESYLGMSGDEILYVGDHIYGDVKVSKSVLRWRTALIVRELEGEILAEDAALAAEERLSGLMRDKERLEHAHARVRLELLRLKDGDGAGAGAVSEEDLTAKMNGLRSRMAARRGDRPAGEGVERAHQPALGPALPRGQRQEPPGAAARAIGRHLHLAGLELPPPHPLRLHAPPARQPPARPDRGRPGPAPC